MGLLFQTTSRVQQRAAHLGGGPLGYLGRADFTAPRRTLGSAIFEADRGRSNAAANSAAVSEPAPLVTDSESTIVAVLRIGLDTKAAQLAELKAPLRDQGNPIATLHGELTRRPSPN